MTCEQVVDRFFDLSDVRRARIVGRGGRWVVHVDNGYAFVAYPCGRDEPEELLRILARHGLRTIRAILSEDKFERRCSTERWPRI